MRAFILFSTLMVAAVMARPEPPVTYLPSQQHVQRNHPVNSHPAKPHVYQQLPSDNGFKNFAAAPAPVSKTNQLPLAMHNEEDSYNAAYRHSMTAQHQSGYSNGPMETQVHKHVYVHVPPKEFEEEESVQPRVTHQMGPKQKHYKIVFIKAPSAPVMRAPIVPPTPQHEEKTLIYVLHKKPEAQPDIVIPTPAPTKPSKPEVFFIKYKTKKEEAPVYGPPPGTYNGEPRQAAEASNEYASIVPNDTADFPQSGAEEETQPQYMNVEQNPESYVEASMTARSDNDVPEPESEQYVAPEMSSTPIVVADSEEEPRTPAATYGSPSRYFIKRRKFHYLFDICFNHGAQSIVFHNMNQEKYETERPECDHKTVTTTSVLMNDKIRRIHLKHLQIVRSMNANQLLNGPLLNPMQLQHQQQ
ncbi:uncharacterized protein LOC133335416 [Musca vetustissima]|uniref:uncharacterized protein LOC133335416 n=1 Tax=Musca vetustissima TaxID=27455 RepID=UPI002AB78404|nr:uncharacterized protein LOC133335416 [Musca vetustissima]